MRGLEIKGIDDIPQEIQEVLRKMPQRFWPEKYRKYASALGVCDNDGDNADQLPDGNSRGASEHAVCTAVSNAMALHASDSDSDSDSDDAEQLIDGKRRGASEHAADSPYDFGEQRVRLTKGMVTRREVKEEELQNMRMVLMNSLTAMRSKGCFQHFSECLSAGQKGMMHYMRIDGEQLYIKTGGDWMQTLWLNMHTKEHADVFNFAIAQAAFSRWIGLPHLLHDAELATEIDGWSEHNLADHNEAATAVLPPKELHLFCELQLAYFRLYGQVDESQTKCAWTEGHGVHKTKCFKNTAWNTRFCRKHYWESEALRTPVVQSISHSSASEHFAI